MGQLTRQLVGDVDGVGAEPGGEVGGLGAGLAGAGGRGGGEEGGGQDEEGEQHAAAAYARRTPGPDGAV
ncbi:hypothetical protein [Streptomyces sp. NPDC057616]|uniref:hypothetical protein n=1 Tax=Streptomyces sp. NPDC057616 TaxID=3346183 RepID=UPI0036C19325